MFDRLERGEVALGTRTDEPAWTEINGHLGMDFSMFDMMVAPTDWADLAHLIRAANRYEVTPWLRLQSYPWGEAHLDPRLPADVLRALSIGVEVVVMSLNTPDEVAAALQPVSNWHRRPYLAEGVGLGNEDLRRLTERLARETIVLPLLESRQGYENLDQILRVKGLRAVFIGMGDLSRELGYAGEPQHPEMRALLKGAVDRARSAGIVAVANTGHMKDPEPEVILEATKWMWDAGVQVVLLPKFDFILNYFYKRVMGPLRTQIPPRAG